MQIQIADPSNKQSDLCCPDRPTAARLALYISACDLQISECFQKNSPDPRKSLTGKQAGICYPHFIVKKQNKANKQKAGSSKTLGDLSPNDINVKSSVLIGTQRF